MSLTFHCRAKQWTPLSSSKYQVLPSLHQTISPQACTHSQSHTTQASPCSVRRFYGITSTFYDSWIPIKQILSMLTVISAVSSCLYHTDAWHMYHTDAWHMYHTDAWHMYHTDAWHTYIHVALTLSPIKEKAVSDNAQMCLYRADTMPWSAWHPFWYNSSSNSIFSLLLSSYHIIYHKDVQVKGNRLKAYHKVSLIALDSCFVRNYTKCSIISYIQWFFIVNMLVNMLSKL